VSELSLAKSAFFSSNVFWASRLPGRNRKRKRSKILSFIFGKYLNGKAGKQVAKETRRFFAFCSNEVKNQNRGKLNTQNQRHSNDEMRVARFVAENLHSED